MYVFRSVFDLDPHPEEEMEVFFWMKNYGKDLRNGCNGCNGLSAEIGAAGTKEPDAGRKNFPFFW